MSQAAHITRVEPFYQRCMASNKVFIDRAATGERGLGHLAPPNRAVPA